MLLFESSLRFGASQEVRLNKVKLGLDKMNNWITSRKSMTGKCFWICRLKFFGVCVCGRACVSVFVNPPEQFSVAQKPTVSNCILLLRLHLIMPLLANSAAK